MELKKKQKVFESMNFEEHDKLDRKSVAENFNKLFENTSQSFVVALDSPWGTGKTQFIYMWKNLLETEQKKAIYLNLWEEDFFQNPFFSLTENLIKEFRERKIGNIEKIKKNIFNLGKEISKSAINKISGINADNFFKGDINKEKKEEKNKFKRNLLKLSNKIKEETNFPLIIFIDELDRCRPNYAIEFLEIVKHFFEVENIIFVLGIDIGQLHHSIKSLYGQDMDAKEYLRKFIDFNYSLPGPSLEKYLDFLFSEFKCGNKEQNLIRISKEIIIKFGPSLRKADNLFTRLKLIEKDINDSYIQATFLLSLKVFEEDKYNNIINAPTSINNILGLNFYFNGRYPDYRNIIFWRLSNDLILRQSYSEEGYINNLKEFFSKFSRSSILEKYDSKTTMRMDMHFSMDNLIRIFNEDNQIKKSENQKVVKDIFNSKPYHLKEFFDLINKIDFLEGLDFNKEEKEKEDGKKS